MATSPERVRRVLGDGPRAPAQPAASDAPARPRGHVQKRLELLGAEAGTAVARADAPGTQPYEGPTLKALLGADERETPMGPLLYVERRLGLEKRHGALCLADAVGRRLRLRPAERVGAHRDALAPEEVVFLDTETTGLAGGTGTVAFLVGTGRIEDGAFVVRQYGMRDYPEEAALLWALTQDLEDRPLVTFNGRSFDWPLLTTRLKLHRMPVRPRVHLDLLPPVRRLWPESLASHRLGALELELLGLARAGDLPSDQVPAAWFEYLRTGRPDDVARAYRHNETDVVTMLVLMGAVASALQDPAGRVRATARDLVGTARHLRDVGCPEPVRPTLEAALARARAEEAPDVLRALGHALRREGAWEEARRCFERLARESPTFDAEAHEQAAKILEHRFRDFSGALEWVTQALPHAPAGSNLEASLRKREARLRRRLARAAAQVPRHGP